MTLYTYLIQVQMQQLFPDWNDNRPQPQIQLSNHLIEKLTDLNRILNLNQKYILTHQNKNILTIAINGLPRSQQEWTQYKFPGKFINYIPPGLEEAKSHQFYRQRLKKANIKFIVQQLDQIVESYGGKVIFAAHSFGSYITTMYTHFHPKKVIGIMEFGGLPIRMYKLLKTAIDSPIFGVGLSDLDNLLELRDQIYQGYLQSIGKNINFMKSSYNLIAFYLIINKQLLQNVFRWRREFPKNILKLIVFGRKDKVFEPKLLHEMATHFTYGDGALNSETNDQLWRIYQLVVGKHEPQFRSIQQRFVYSLPKTGHGPHIVRKEQIQNIMNLYLSIVLADIAESPRL